MQDAQDGGPPALVYVCTMPRGYPLVGAVVADRGTLPERLWAKIVRGEPDACWGWTGATLREGRGKIAVDGRARPAARVLVALRDGLDLDDPTWHARHTCDTPTCHNPAHLVQGTPRQNAGDMVQRGRSTARERHPMARLSEQQVAAIRAERAAGTPRREVAERYGVHPEHVTRVTSGRSW